MAVQRDGKGERERSIYSIIEVCIMTRTVGYTYFIL